MRVPHLFRNVDLVRNLLYHVQRAAHQPALAISLAAYRQRGYERRLALELAVQTAYAVRSAFQKTWRLECSAGFTATRRSVRCRSPSPAPSTRDSPRVSVRNRQRRMHSATAMRGRR